MINVHVIFKRRDPRMAQSLSWHSRQFPESSLIGSKIRSILPSSDLRYWKILIKVARCFGFKVASLISTLIVVTYQGTFRTACVMEQYPEPEETSRKNLCCGLQWVQVQSKEIDVDDESSDSKVDFKDDVGPSKNTRGVIIESDEEDDWSIFQINLCFFSKFKLTRFTCSLITCIKRRPSMIVR